MLSCVGPSSRCARSNARPVSSAMRALLFTCAWYLVILLKIGSCSVSWKPPRPSVIDPVSGVMQTTGECAQYAAATDVTKLVMPGPFCEMRSPGRPGKRCNTDAQAQQSVPMDRQHEQDTRGT